MSQTRQHTAGAVIGFNSGETMDRSAEVVRKRTATFREMVYAAGHVLDDGDAPHSLWPVAITKPAGDFLRDLVIRERAARTLEIGVGLGLSTLATIEGLATVNEALTAESHVTIDPTPSWCNGAGVRVLKESGAMSVTRLVLQPSEICLPAMIAAGESFDFAFVDGAHWFDNAIIDMFFAMRLVRPDGLIVMDDHWMPSIQTALAFAVTNWGVELELFDAAGPGKRLVAFRNTRKYAERAWDQFTPFSRSDLPAYPWRA